MQPRAWSGAFVLTIVLLASHVLLDEQFSALRGKTYDLYQTLLPAKPVSSPVILVTIDDRSLEEHGRWPWNRSLVADLIDAVSASGARVVGLDILFPEPDTEPGGDQGDRRLAEALAGSRTVLAVSTETTPTTRRTLPKAGWSLVGDVPADLPAIGGIIASRPAFNDAAAGLGVIRATPDGDGTLRRIPLIWLQRDGGELQLWPSFAMELVRLYMEEDAFVARMRDGGFDALKLGSSIFPMTPNGAVFLRERVGSLPVVSAADLLAGKSVSDLDGAIVIVAVSAAGLDQYHLTPAQVARLGAEVHGLIIEQLLKGEFLAEPDHVRWFERAWFAAGAVLLILLGPISGSRPYVAVPAMIVTVLSPVAAGFSAFSAGILFEGLQSAAGLLLIAIGSGYANYRLAEQRRRALVRQFSQFLSPAIVAKLASDDAEALIAVEKREITVLIMDIRGFTPMTHTLAAPQIVAVVNHFLGIATDEILKRDGTIDKFMGDAVLAIWNAPIEVADHADRALAAAEAIIARVATANAELENQSLPPLKVGAGLETGVCSVGNFGSRRRIDYTAVGDTVNLSARLENATKTTGVGLLTGPGFALATKRSMRRVGRLKLQGFNEEIEAYTVAGSASD